MWFAAAAVWGVEKTKERRKHARGARRSQQTHNEAGPGESPCQLSNTGGSQPLDAAGGASPHG